MLLFLFLFLTASAALRFKLGQNLHMRSHTAAFVVQYQGRDSPDAMQSNADVYLAQQPDMVNKIRRSLGTRVGTRHYSLHACGGMASPFR